MCMFRRNKGVFFKYSVDIRQTVQTFHFLNFHWPIRTICNSFNENLIRQTLAELIFMVL